MSSEPTQPQSSQPTWYTKARSRAWSKPKRDYSRIPLWALTIGTFFFTGLSPAASGTVGSAVAAALYCFIPPLQSTWVLISATVVVFVLGTIASNSIERSLNEHDPGIIVADEVIGQWITLLSFTYTGNVTFVVIGFLMFRMFDIIKLYPASIFEKRPGGFGVMADDAVAGIYANISTHLIMWLLVKVFPSVI